MITPLKKRLFAFSLFLIIAAIAAFSYWFFISRLVEKTDDAYVQGEITQISSRLNAHIKTVLIKDNQHVHKHQLLVTLDQSDFLLSEQKAEANLETVKAQLAEAKSTLSQQNSVIAEKKSAIVANKALQKRTQQNLSRLKSLVKPGYVSVESVNNMESNDQVAKSEISKSRAKLASEIQKIQTLNAQIKSLQAKMVVAQAEIDQAKLDLSRTKIYAPISGVIGQRSAREGQYVQSGTYLLSIVPEQDIWIQANFKETQIEKMKPGQTVKIVFDSFPSTPIEGTVDSLFAASGAQFSLLPPDNATGNFTKVVQRIPVKINIPKDNKLSGRIRPGMSAVVTVKISSLNTNVQ